MLQSLTLWREITSNMYLLWRCADDDLLGGSQYRLMNTGQGLNRVCVRATAVLCDAAQVQSCPRVGSAMHQILSRVQQRCGSWVGLSVVHLGDRDVPNAFMFIDKVASAIAAAPHSHCAVHAGAAHSSADRSVFPTTLPRSPSQ